MRTHLAAAAALFAVALGVRCLLLQGLVLGDDPQEFATLLTVLADGPRWADQLQLRFGGWILNHVVFWLFGVSETAFLAPTVVLTSTFAVMAYALLVRWGYGRWRAFLGGLLVATTPFEVMLGTLRANDSYLEFALAAAFVGLVFLEERPVRQGVVLALCLWFGFYVKLWVVYVLPALGLYYLVGRRWRAAAAFTIVSLVVHGLTCVFWKVRLDTFLPFIAVHAANYAVPRQDLPGLFLTYLRLLFVGSMEFPTTLFGAVPYVVVVLVLVKAVGSALGDRVPACVRLDRPDHLLLAAYGSFLLLLEFFPNGFQLDAYYSVPRIFRYLAPVSFPIALHAAKLALDVARVPIRGVPRAAATLAVGLAFLAVNLAQAVEATSLGRLYRANLLAVLRDVRAAKPPMLIAEAIIASYLRDLYLDPVAQQTEVPVLWEEHSAADYEGWLRAHESAMPADTLLLTGLAGFVHYGAHADGYRLRQFARPLSPAWKPLRRHGLLTYLPQPEAVRLWRLEFPEGARPAVHDAREDLSRLGDADAAALFRAGMARYDAADYPGARVYFAKILRTRPGEGEDAGFFYAASFFREAEWRRARHEFKRLIRRHPESHWIPGAYWHLAMCELRMGRVARARRMFAAIMRRFPEDPTTLELARGELDRIERTREGALARWWRSL